MNIIYFSPSSCGFYDSQYESEYKLSGSWPGDLVEVSDELRMSYTGANPDGKLLGSDDSGMPVWVDAPPKTNEQIEKESAEKRSHLKSIADAEISWRQDAVSEGIATDKEVSDLSAWKKYRVLLMRVDVSNPEWPSVPE